MNAIHKQTKSFQLVDIERACPSVSRDWIQALFTEMKNKGKLCCSGKGPAARWTYEDV